MRVLIGCEESGKVRDAFASMGHDAWSCDLLPTRSLGNHLQMDIFKAICYFGPWDIIILHPDCTYLTVAGNRWYGRNGASFTDLRHDKNHGYKLRLNALKWTKELWCAAKAAATIGCALENPIGVLPTLIGKPTQYINPWEYGHGETKKTCLWLHGLPNLEPTNIVEGREQRIWKMAPGPNRKRDRSETYQGWADAFAEQWNF